jgi:hypothetical protein
MNNPLVPIIIASCDPTHEDNPRYPEWMLGCMVGWKVNEVDTGGHHWVKKYFVPEAITDVLAKQKLSQNQVHRILSAIIHISAADLKMICNPELLQDQVLELFQGVINNPGPWITLPPDMPFWMKHKILGWDDLYAGEIARLPSSPDTTR